MIAIDLFCGLGGLTAGAELSGGVDVVWAANHNHLAVSVHSRNHPDTIHLCQDLHQADWRRVPSHDLCLAAPACQGHSQAGQPNRYHHPEYARKHTVDRATAWAVVSCLEYHRPRFVLVENVVDFRRWELYPAWRTAMETLGYHLTENVLDAADVGVPQSRKRLFIVGALEAPVTIRQPSVPRKAASSFLRWREGSWSPVDKPGRGPRVAGRVARGRANFGSRFLLHHVTGHPGRSIDRPIGTITTKDQWAVVDGDLMRPLLIDEYKEAMGFEPSYVVPTSNRAEAVRLLGAAVPPPLAAHCVGEIAAVAGASA